MKRYEIELDEAVSNFFEEVAIIVQHPIKELLLDTLFKQVEVISCKISKANVSNDANMY